LRAGVSQFWACMVLWETVGCAELTTAVLASEGKNRFGCACLAFHREAPFLCKWKGFLIFLRHNHSKNSLKS
jgi:hypothetical protein